jgi:hypothetical protein
LAVVALAAVSVRPAGAVELVLDHALMPVRVLSELARPVGWLTARRVRAADRSLAELTEDDYGRRASFFADGARYAEPDRPELIRGRRFVHAEVIDRDGEDRIVIEIRGGSCAGLKPTMPVVSGNAYVGRIREVLPDAGRATVDLVTGLDFFVGAVLESGEEDPERPLMQSLRLVVGGVVTKEDEAGRYWLDVHNPSRTSPPAGRVTVDEDLSALDPYGDEARGFELGHYDPEEQGIVPLLNFHSGLFQVVVVAPAGLDRPPETGSTEELEDGRWRRVVVTSSGDPSAWREGLKLGAGSWNGVGDGAALVSGSRLVGRVRDAGPLTANASLLGDPGLAIPAIARVEGRQEPLVLGQLISLGRDPEDVRRVRFHWEALLAWEGPEAARAELFTGSGEPLIPRGLLLGLSELPPGPGPHVLTLEQPVDTRDVRSLWVRLPAPEPLEPADPLESGEPGEDS